MYYKGKQLTEEEAISLLNQDVWNIKNIKNPSYSIQQISITKNPYMLVYIQNPCDEISIMAIKQNANVILNIQNPSQKLINIAIRKKPFLMQHFQDTKVIQQKATNFHTKKYSLSKLLSLKNFNK